MDANQRTQENGPTPRRPTVGFAQLPPQIANARKQSVRIPRKSVHEVIMAQDVRRAVELDMQMVLHRARQRQQEEDVEKAAAESLSNNRPGSSLHFPFLSGQGEERSLSRQGSQSARLPDVLSRDGPIMPNSARKEGGFVRPPLVHTGSVRKRILKIRQKAYLQLRERVSGVNIADDSKSARRHWLKLRFIILRSRVMTVKETEQPATLELVTIKDLHNISNEFHKRSASGLINIQQFVFSLASCLLVPFSELIRTFRAVDAENKGHTSYSEFVTFLYNKYKSGVAEVVARQMPSLVPSLPDETFVHVGVIDRIIVAHDIEAYITCSRDSSVKIWSTNAQARPKSIVLPVEQRHRKILNIEQGIPSVDDSKRVNRLYSVIIDNPEVAPRVHQSVLSHLRPSIAPGSIPESVLLKKVSTLGKTKPAPKSRPVLPNYDDPAVNKILRSPNVVNTLRPPPPPLGASRTTLSHYVGAVKAAADSAMEHTIRQRIGTESYTPSHIKELKKRRGKLVSTNATTWPLDVAYYPKSRRMYAAYSDKLVAVYDLDRKGIPSYVGSLALLSTPCRMITIDPSGFNPRYTFEDPERLPPLLIIGDEFGKCIFYNINNNQHLGIRSLLSSPISYMLHVPSMYLIVAGSDASVILIDPWKQEAIGKLLGQSRAIVCLTYSTEYNLICGGGVDGKVIIWNAYSQFVTGRIRAHDHPIAGIAFDSRNRLLITASSSKQIKLWNVHTLSCLQTVMDRTIHVPRNKLSTLVMDPKKCLVISAGSGCHIWPISTSTPGSKMNVISLMPSSTIVGLHYSPALKQVISVSCGGHVQVWEVKKLSLSFEFNLSYQEPVTASELDFNFCRLMTSHADGILKAWNFNSGQIIHTYESSQRELYQLLHLSPIYERNIIGVGSDQGVVTWVETPMNKDAEIPAELPGHHGHALCITLCGNLLASGDSEGSILVRMIEPPKILHHIQITGASPREHTSVEKMCYLKKRHLLIVGTSLGSIHVVDPHRGRIVRENAGSLVDQVTGIVADEEESHLMVTDVLGYAKMWSTSDLCSSEFTTKPLRFWRAHTVKISSCVYFPMMSYFLTGTSRGDVAVWTFNGMFRGYLGQSDRKYDGEVFENDNIVITRRRKGSIADQDSSTGDEDSLEEEEGSTRIKKKHGSPRKRYYYQHRVDIGDVVAAMIENSSDESSQPEQEEDSLSQHSSDS